MNGEDELEELMDWFAGVYNTNQSEESSSDTQQPDLNTYQVGLSPSGIEYVTDGNTTVNLKRPT